VVGSPPRRWLVTVPALVLLAVALVLALGPAETPYLDLVRRGDGHAARAERTAAVAAYREAARLRPGDPAPYLRLGRVYLDWGRTEEALAALTRARRLGAEEVDPVELERLWVATCVARADWPAVVEHAQRLLALLPPENGNEDGNGNGNGDERAAARHALAHAYLHMREWDAARVVYEATLRADPADALAHERLGVLELGHDPAAVQHLYAAGSEPTDVANRVLAAYQRAGAVDDPAYASALVGRVLSEEQEWALAARQFERAVSENPDYADAHAYLGHALDHIGRPDEARPHLLRAVALAPGSATAHTFLGLHYDRLGDVVAARAEYETAYDLDPENPATCVEIGQTWAVEGRYVAAEIWLREAVFLQPEDPALWEVLTRFYLDHSITAEGRGVESAKRLLELSPDDPVAHDLRGWAALQVGDYDAAQESLQQALSLDPALAEAHYHLGLLWTALGADHKVRGAFIRALDLDTSGDLVPLVERALEALPLTPT